MTARAEGKTRPDLGELHEALGTQEAAYNGHPWPSRKEPTNLQGRDNHVAREQRWLALGLHPRSGIELAPAGTGTCNDCAHRVRYVSPLGECRRVHWKCELTRPYRTEGRATDVLLDWPACQKWARNPALPEKPPGG